MAAPHKKIFVNIQMHNINFRDISAPGTRGSVPMPLKGPISAKCIKYCMGQLIIPEHCMSNFAAFHASFLAWSSTFSLIFV